MNHKLKHLIIIGLIGSFVILLLIILNIRANPHFIWQSDCAAPCWRQINPGKTNFTSAVAIVEKFPDLRYQDSVEILNEWNIFSKRIFFTLKSGETIRIYFIDDVVAKISLTNKRGLSSFSDCIKIFNYPENVSRSSLLGPGSFFLPASSAIHEWFFAIYPNRGIGYGFDMYKAGTRLKESTSVTDLYFFDINMYQLLLSKGFLVYSDSDYRESSLQPWKGYGDINELYPSGK